MTIVNSDLQKLEALLKSATNQRQRKMYQSLLDKARKEIADQEPVQNSKQAAELKVNFRSKAPKESASPLEVKPTNSVKKQKQSEPIEEQVLLSATVKKQDTTINVAQDHCGDRLVEPFEVNHSQSKPQGESQSKLANQPNIFQAVGLIRCTPQIKEDKMFVTMGDRDYELKKGTKWSHKHFDKLKEEIEQNGSKEVWLRVYPNIIHDSKNKEIRYWFTLVKAFQEKSDCFLQEEVFTFRGIWQYVSYCHEPVISVHRNIDNLKFYHRLSFKAKKSFARPQDFPVVWSAPVEPFKYNSELNQTEQMPRHFVQVKATLFDDRFQVVKMISEPILDIPKYIKPPRNKTKSQSEK